MRDYKTVDGLIRNGCAQEDAQKITQFIEFLDECFEQHNREASGKNGEQGGD